MATVELPDTVLEALGSQAASDFSNWLEERLQNAGLVAGVQISAFVARQKVNVLVLEQISNLLLAGTPKLIQTAGKWFWRVPIDLTLPSKGRIGRVGTIDVDALYGQLQYDEPLLTQITNETERLIQ
jgi:hypothetical protein